MRMATGGVRKGGDMTDSTNDTSENETDSEKTLAKKRRLRGPNEKCLLPTHLLHRLRAGPGGASCITFSPSGNLLAFAACDEPLPGKIDLLQIQFQGRNLHVLDSAFVSFFEYYIFFYIGSHCIVIANPDSGAVCALLHGHCAIVYSLSFSSDGRRILSTSGDGTARIWCQKEARSNVSLSNR